MSVQEDIQAKLAAQLSIAHLEVLNESHMHSGPATESHFKIIAVSSEFEGVSPVKRHQRLYEILAQELKGGVHALALHLYTPEQWAQKNASAPLSPNCAGAKH
ncbi:MAG: BolA/IbaG family iron-sulfur metabolism protein [Pseudohongiellaceae bacterium]|nr:BolA/IbaG family iron-sulfur metabolism protein [Pseudohongiellaceae bacterium]